MRIVRNTRSHIRALAKSNLDRRLQKQGLSEDDMSVEEYRRLLRKEIRLLTDDAKKVGAGLAIGFAISLLTGF